MALLDGCCAVLLLLKPRLSGLGETLFGATDFGGARPQLRLYRIFIMFVATAGIAECTLAQVDLGFTRAIVCIDRATGALLWSSEVAVGSRGQMHRNNSPATPTPAVDDAGVYAYFGDPGLVATDHFGKPRWSQKLAFQSSFGAGVSPIVSGGAVVVSSGTGSQSYVVALDAGTGRQLWRHDRPPGTHNGENRTPGVATIGNSKMVIVWAHRHLLGLELSTGRELFKYQFLNTEFFGSLVASFVVTGDFLYLPTTAGAYKLSLTRLMAKRDPVLWVARSGGSDCASPVVVKGLLFAVSAGGIASSIDANTGQILWKVRLVPGDYYSSLFSDGVNVYASSMDGLITVFTADRSFRTVGRIDMGEAVLASMGAAGGQLVIRTSRHVYAVGAGPSPRAVSELPR
jgi:outer membrane protein assembly factor BamB